MFYINSEQKKLKSLRNKMLKLSNKSFYNLKTTKNITFLIMLCLRGL